ncbi:MAG: YvcK family protein [bacterium]|nr:YvcK family protein [bacterium]
MPKTSKKKIVVIGGGTGTFQVLTGLKKYPNLELCAIVTMSDSGGSTGRLRKELSILPPGDVRRALIALSNLPLAQKTIEKLFDFRFESGKGLKGHSMGNLLLAALMQITGREDLAIKEASRILAVSGFVYPVTLDKTHLVAILENGKRIKGESKIDLRHSRETDWKIPIKKVFLIPKGKIFKDTERAIRSADLIVLGPGDLYTSIIPNLLVDGVSQAILASGAKVALIINLMTKPGETDGFFASDFVGIIKEYLGPAQKKLTHVIMNTKFPHSVQTLSWYLRHSSKPVADDLEELNELSVIRGVFTQKGELLRHDPAKLAKVLMKII